MTFDEAIFCMKQYLSDSDSLECMKCPYYHTVPIEGTENGFTCKADEAHKIAIKALETIPKYKDAYNKGWDDGAKASYEHLKMCEEEQGGDLISRDAVIDIIHRFFTEEVDKIPTKKTEDGEVYVIHKCQPLFEMNKAICKRIKALPSVTAEPKTGHWEWVQYDYNPKLGDWHCSECRCVVLECVDKEKKGGIPLYKYCPQCGAKMVEPQESEDKG